MQPLRVVPGVLAEAEAGPAAGRAPVRPRGHAIRTDPAQGAHPVHHALHLGGPQQDGGVLQDERGRAGEGAGGSHHGKSNSGATI